ncbi:HNH endonuclease [Gordonia caeni]|uniref:HNH nuclease domain-containing protein n=1 Tax=Gordonia caeni TaxID=1007097 RepID=A0ABP7PIB4_9ACTN
MAAYVGVTDRDWYEFLFETGPLHPEVNFWFPSPKQGFKAVRVGEPFVFKTHYGRSPTSNRLVGVGLFSGFARATVSEAWSLFGIGNGVESVDILRHRIEHYRKQKIGPLEDPEIGCVLLHDVVFFAPDETLPAPDGFAPSIQRGKIWDLVGTDSVVEAVLRHQIAVDQAQILSFGPTTGAPVPTVPRIGQQAFKAMVAETYGHHCAITGEKVRPVLEAAHILPVAAGGMHRVDNGLLLRSDVHTLFDRGYIGVDTKYRLRVSPALKSQFGNGDWFYAREGMTLDVPTKRAQRPNRGFLEWHNDEVFLS